MGRKGEITVFLAMILVSVCALLCGLVESARTAGARCSLRMSVNGSMDSLMSQFHRKLWRDYRILGLEHEGEESLEKEMEGFLRACLEGENWYPMKVEEIKIREMASLTGGQGRYMEGEILEYMKYGLIETVWEALTEEEANSLLKSWKEGEMAAQVSKLYSGHTEEALRLEKALESVNERLLDQKAGWERAAACLENLDGSRFLSQAKDVIKDLDKVPRLVDTYERRADELKARLNESRKAFEAGKGDLGENVRAALEDEIEQYESYVSADGERRREIANLRVLAPAGIEWIQGVIQEAEAVMEYIDNWEPESDEDELDEEELWGPVKSVWRGYKVLSLGIEFGVKDKEKGGLLETIGDLAAGGLLELVLPEGTVISGKRLSLEGAPSRGYGEGTEGSGKSEERPVGSGRPGEGPGGSGEPEEGPEERQRPGEEPGGSGFGGAESGLWGGGAIKGADSMADRVIIGEYAIRFFESFRKEMAGDSFYELEYILQGKEGDRDNLAGVAALLVAVRQGLNLVHILSDSAKRQEARALAMSIVGAAGFLPLVSVVSFFVMAVWALGEALLDVRNLLAQGKVPLFKTRDEWKLGLEGLLDMGRNKGLGDGFTGEGGREKGTDYKGYLRILIFTRYGRDMIYRMMDVMEINIREDQPGFAMARCVCMVDMEVRASGKHVFFSTGLWKSPGGDGGLGYETNMEVSGSYLGEK